MSNLQTPFLIPSLMGGNTTTIAKHVENLRERSLQSDSVTLLPRKSPDLKNQSFLEESREIARLRSIIEAYIFEIYSMHEKCYNQATTLDTVFAQLEEGAELFDQQLKESELRAFNEQNKFHAIQTKTQSLMNSLSATGSLIQEKQKKIDRLQEDLTYCSILESFVKKVTEWPTNPQLSQSSENIPKYLDILERLKNKENDVKRLASIISIRDHEVSLKNNQLTELGLSFQSQKDKGGRQIAALKLKLANQEKEISNATERYKQTETEWIIARATNRRLIETIFNVYNQVSTNLNETLDLAMKKLDIPIYSKIRQLMQKTKIGMPVESTTFVDAILCCERFDELFDFYVSVLGANYSSEDILRVEKSKEKLRKSRQLT